MGMPTLYVALDVMRRTILNVSVVYGVAWAVRPRDLVEARARSAVLGYIVNGCIGCVKVVRPIAILDLFREPLRHPGCRG